MWTKQSLHFEADYHSSSAKFWMEYVKGNNNYNKIFFKVELTENLQLDPVLPSDIFLDIVVGSCTGQYVTMMAWAWMIQQ